MSLESALAFPPKQAWLAFPDPKDATLAYKGRSGFVTDTPAAYTAAD